MSLKGYLSRHGIILGNTDEVLITAKFFKTSLDPTAMTNTAAIIPLALIGGLIVGTPTAAAAYTVPTGTELDAKMTSFMINNAYFDFSIINVATGDGYDITLTANTGITIVGEALVESTHNNSSHFSSGWFRCRKTAANTFIIYRLA